MDTTTFLAQLWGPVIFAVALGIFISRSYYVKIYRDLEKDALAVLLFGMVAIATGIAHVAAHNVWNTLPQVVVSLLGWGLLIKGALFIIAPGIVDRGGNWWVSSKLIPAVGVIMLVIGAYVSCVGYF